MDCEVVDSLDVCTVELCTAVIIWSIVDMDAGDESVILIVVKGVDISDVVDDDEVEDSGGKVICVEEMLLLVLVVEDLVVDEIEDKNVRLDDAASSVVGEVTEDENAELEDSLVRFDVVDVVCKVSDEWDVELDMTDAVDSGFIFVEENGETDACVVISVTGEVIFVNSAVVASDEGNMEVFISVDDIVVDCVVEVVDVVVMKTSQTSPVKSGSHKQLKLFVVGSEMHRPEFWHGLSLQVTDASQFLPLNLGRKWWNKVSIK